MRQPRLWLVTRLGCSCVGGFPFRVDPVASLSDIGYAMSPDGPRSSGCIWHVGPCISSLQCGEGPGARFPQAQAQA